MKIVEDRSLLDARAGGELDRAVEAALDSGDQTGLPVVGFGEVSTCWLAAAGGGGQAAAGLRLTAAAGR